VAYFVNLFGGLILARLLTPGLYGVWKIVQLTLQYTQFANLGIHFGLGKTCPSLITKGRLDRYRQLMGASLGFSLLAPVAGAAGLFVAAALLDAGPLRVGLLALAILLPMQQFHTHADLSLSIEKRFGIKARAFLGYTLIRVALCVYLAYAAGLTGALAAFTITHGIFSYYMWRHSRMGLRVALAKDVTRRMIRIALPITFVVVGELILSTADKWVVAVALGTDAMGLYQMAIFPLPLLMLLPASMRQVVSMEVYDRFGHTHQLASVRDVVERSFLILALGSPVFIGAVYFGMPWLIDWLLPAYRPSIPATLLHALLIYPILITQTGYSVLIITRQERRTFLALLGVTGLSTAASLIATLGFHAPFLTVLWIHGAGWLVYGFGILHVNQRLFGESRGRSLYRALRWFLPMAYLCVELPLLYWAVGRLGLAEHGFLHAMVGGLLHLGACAPFLLRLEKRTGAVSEALRMIARRLRLIPSDPRLPGPPRSEL
jgi:O-antigen/teichoic acid export membrane protein